MANLRSRENAFTSETAREAQKKGVQAKLTAKAFRQEAMKQFHKGKRDQQAFSALADKAAKGDINATEQLRKWIDKDDEDKAQGTTINLVMSSEEKVAIDKWSR